MENDDNLVKMKTLAEFNQSTTPDVDKSITMADQVAKSQENGVRVSEEGRMDSSADNTGVDKGGDKIDRIEVGNLVEAGNLTQKTDCDDDNDDGDDDDSKLILKSHGRRGRKTKIEAGEKRDLDRSLLVNGNKSDLDEKIADIFSSSISQRTRNRVITGKKEEIGDMEVNQNARNVYDDDDGDDDDDDDHESRFSVGDFVWGKIKSHPWWPGRIFDPSNASDYALKYKHEGRLLVAYFGDDTFAWCDSSQLKPFEENFEIMSKQSNLRSFVNAVEEAVDEFGKLVELQMTCSSARKDTQSSLPVLENAGIKEGVHVPIVGFEKFSVVHFEPTSMLEDIRRLARFISVSNVLELTVLKARLSAFCHAKGGWLLPMYYEPLGIEDIVDIDRVSKEGSARGPDDGDKSRKRRKERSISELLGMSEKIEVNGNHTDSPEGEMKSEKLVSKSGKKRKKIIDENQIHEVDNPIITRSSSRSKHGSAKSTTDEQKISNGADDRKRKKSMCLKVNNGDTGEEGHERMSPRERKLSKYLSPPFTNLLHRQRNSSSQMEFSDIARMGEKMDKIAHKNSSKELENIGSSNNVLYQIQSLALDPLYSTKDESFDTIKGFLSSYRSSNYKNGSNYHAYKKQTESKEVKDQKKKKKSKSSETQEGNMGSENEPLAVVFIKQKLEGMTSMLAQSDGKMSEEIKSNLENEVKELLKKVKLMTSSSSS